MHAADLLGAVEIGERARDPEHPVIAARREMHGIGGVAQQCKPAGIGACHFLQERAIGGGVAADGSSRKHHIGTR
jgi:hypothetical protein